VINWIKERIAQHKAAKEKEQKFYEDIDARTRQWEEKTKSNRYDMMVLYQRLGGPPALNTAEFLYNLNRMIEDARIEGLEAIPNQSAPTFYIEALWALRKIEEARNVQHSHCEGQ